MSSILFATSILLITFGFLLRYWRGRRKFYRRNAAGIESFSNYHRSLLTRSFESLLLLISYLAIAMGLLLMTALSCNRRWVDRWQHRSVTPSSIVAIHSDSPSQLTGP